ncbi:hypothetical protein FPQ18DRAFT_111211 [Pyronema domesticum]|nr:hypothetical protein FPQ18DRAFT_111211 [Pyronema domesticum]
MELQFADKPKCTARDDFNETNTVSNLSTIDSSRSSKHDRYTPAADDSRTRSSNKTQSHRLLIPVPFPAFTRTKLRLPTVNFFSCHRDTLYCRSFRFTLVMFEGGRMWDNRMSTWRMEKKEAERKAAKDIAKEVAEKRRKMRELCKPITSRPFLKPKGYHLYIYLQPDPSYAPELCQALPSFRSFTYHPTATKLLFFDPRCSKAEECGTTECQLGAWRRSLPCGGRQTVPMT